MMTILKNEFLCKTINVYSYSCQNYEAHYRLIPRFETTKCLDDIKILDRATYFTAV